MITRTYKYRLYPTKAQEICLGNILYQSRCLYNKALEHRVKSYQEEKKHISYIDQWNLFKPLRKTDYTLLNASSTQQLLRRLDKAFKAFFARCKKGDKLGFPRFKYQDRFNSAEYKDGDGAKFKPEGKKSFLYVQNAGDVKVKYHRDIPQDATIKHIVIKRCGSKWQVNLCIESSQVTKISANKEDIGIDVGLTHLATLSNGTFFDSPKYFKQSQQKLRRVQRKLSRCKRGSKRRKKVKRNLANLHQHIADQRNDFLHKITTKIAYTYKDISVEDMSLDFMLKNKHLAKSATDNAIGIFLNLLTYKVENTGNKLTKVNPKHTSQICSSCGTTVKKTLATRTHKCSNCGLILDRDVNAALNISKLGTSCRALTSALAEVVREAV